MSRQNALGLMLALALVAVCVERWPIAWMAMTPWRGSLLAFAVSAAWLGLLVASMAGLLLGRRWGAICLVALVPVSTVLHGVPLVPFVTKAFPLESRWPLVIGLNVVVLLCAIVLLRPARNAQAI